MRKPVTNSQWSVFSSFFSCPVSRLCRTRFFSPWADFCPAHSFAEVELYMDIIYRKLYGDSNSNSSFYARSKHVSCLLSQLWILFIDDRAEQVTPIKLYYVFSLLFPYLYIPINFCPMFILTILIGGHRLFSLQGI